VSQEASGLKFDPSLSANNFLEPPPKKKVRALLNPYRGDVLHGVLEI
jgi:hypothetical protein